MIKIWNPRWHDRKALIAKYKVRRGDNTIIFTKAKSLKGITFKMDGNEIVKYPIETNGVIECYAVPLDKLERSDYATSNT